MSKSVQMSGYLPGAEHQNLTEVAEDLAARFNTELAEHGEAHVLFPVVAMMKVTSVDTDAESGRTVKVKVVGLEAPGGRDAGMLRDTWRSLHQARNGQLVQIEGLEDIMRGDGSARPDDDLDDDGDDDDEDGQELPGRPALAAAAFSDSGVAPGRSTH